LPASSSFLVVLLHPSCGGFVQCLAVSCLISFLFFSSFSCYYWPLLFFPFLPENPGRIFSFWRHFFSKSIENKNKTSNFQQFFYNRERNSRIIDRWMQNKKTSLKKIEPKIQNRKSKQPHNVFLHLPAINADK